MSDRLRDKRAVVTAAGSGIGRACALRFAAEGARVLVNDVDADRAAAVAAEIEAGGGTARAAPGDVADPACVAALVREAQGALGGLDVWVNNAAAPLPGPVAEIADETWREVHRVTLDGTFYGVRAALGAMLEAGGGSIINVASGAALGGSPMLGAYAAAKAAVVNLTRTAAVENAARGVRVNAICPGAIATPPMLAFAGQLPGGRNAFERQIPAKRLGRPEEVAALALFLASDESAYVTGAVLVVDGGVSAQLASPRTD